MNKLNAPHLLLLQFVAGVVVVVAVVVLVVVAGVFHFMSDCPTAMRNCSSSDAAPKMEHIFHALFEFSQLKVCLSIEHTHTHIYSLSFSLPLSPRPPWHCRHFISVVVVAAGVVCCAICHVSPLPTPVFICSLPPPLSSAPTPHPAHCAVNAAAAHLLPFIKQLLSFPPPSFHSSFYLLFFLLSFLPAFIQPFLLVPSS